MKNNLISFSLSLGLSAIVTAVIFLVTVFSTLNFGGENIYQSGNRQKVILIAIIFVAVLATIFVVGFIKKGNYKAALGAGLLPLIMFVVTVIGYIANYNFHTEFDKTKWEQSKLKPFKMAATLVKENKLIGLTGNEVKEMTGPEILYEDTQADIGAIAYTVEMRWQLIVNFRNGRVVEARLQRHGICL